MKIDFLVLKEDIEVPAGVITWMQKHSKNHLHLLAAWSEEPYSDFANDWRTVMLCLAYEVQSDNPRYEIARRILGKARKLRNGIESIELERVCGKTSFLD